MRMLTPPTELLPIRDKRLRFRKVIKHLYRPVERWQQICHELPDDPRRVALSAGCSADVLRLPGSSVSEYRAWSVANALCRACVLRDHDMHFLPEARGAVETSRAAAHSRPASDDKVLHAGLNGVFAVTRGSAPRLVTAFRIAPETDRPGGPTVEDFVQSAVRRVRDCASLAEDAEELDARDEDGEERS